MPEKVKGHYRRGLWIGPYMREPKDRTSPSTQGVVNRDIKWNKEFHDCCEGIICCICEEKLEVGEIEPVGHGLKMWHRFCGDCLWQMSGVQASAAAKRQGCGGSNPSASESGVEKHLALLGLPSDFLESTDGE
jgi:hypothetical protein